MISNATRAFLVLARLCLLATFAVAGANKISARNRTRRSMETFGVPSRFAGFFATFLPLCELAVALGLTRRVTVHSAAAAALLMLIAFTAAVSANLALNRKPECACFGAIWPSPIGSRIVVRNIILAVASTAVLLGAPAREFVRPAPSAGWPQTSGMVLAVALGLGMLLGAGSAFRRLRRQCGAPPSKAARRILKPAPPTGLPTGASAPRFSVALLDGRAATLDWLVHGGQRALVLFASPECAHCSALLPVVVKLQDRLRVMVLLSGDPEASRRTIGSHDLKIAAVDIKALVARQFRIAGVPSAVLIGPNGAIASNTAAGAKSVLKLLTQLSGSSGLSQ